MNLAPKVELPYATVVVRGLKPSDKSRVVVFRISDEDLGDLSFELFLTAGDIPTEIVETVFGPNTHGKEYNPQKSVIHNQNKTSIRDPSSKMIPRGLSNGVEPMGVLAERFKVFVAKPNKNAEGELERDAKGALVYGVQSSGKDIAVEAGKNRVYSTPIQQQQFQATGFQQTGALGGLGGLDNLTSMSNEGFEGLMTGVGQGPGGNQLTVLGSGLGGLTIPNGPTQTTTFYPATAAKKTSSTKKTNSVPRPIDANAIPAGSVEMEILDLTSGQVSVNRAYQVPGGPRPIAFDAKGKYPYWFAAPGPSYMKVDTPFMRAGDKHDKRVGGTQAKGALAAFQASERKYGPIQPMQAGATSGGNTAGWGGVASQQQQMGGAVTTTGLGGLGGLGGLSTLNGPTQPIQQNNGFIQQTSSGRVANGVVQTVLPGLGALNMPTAQTSTFQLQGTGIQPANSQMQLNSLLTATAPQNTGFGVLQNPQQQFLNQTNNPALIQPNTTAPALADVLGKTAPLGGNQLGGTLAPFQAQPNTGLKLTSQPQINTGLQTALGGNQLAGLGTLGGTITNSTAALTPFVIPPPGTVAEDSDDEEDDGYDNDNGSSDSDD